MFTLPDPIKPYFVVSVLIFTFYYIFKGNVLPLKGLLPAILLFLIFDIVQADDVFTAISNKAVISVILLVLMAAGINTRYNPDFIINRLVVTKKGHRPFLFSIMLVSSALSSFINNTAVVAFMIPFVHQWSKKNNLSPSKLMMPLSFATILGGMITIIGTSTTLVLQGFIQYHGEPGLDTFNLFLIGIAVTITGVLFLGYPAQKLLPSKEDLISTFKSTSREYLVETILTKNSSLTGKSVAEAGLRNLKGLFLVEILREKENIAPVAPQEIIQQKDVLIFAGNTNDILNLTKSDIGLTFPRNPDHLPSFDEIVEVVISQNSSLLGMSIKNTNFRERYDSAVIAIHRNGRRVQGKIGDINLHVGDVLLLFSGKGFSEKADVYKDLYIISQKRNQPPVTRSGKINLLLLMILATLLFVTNYFSLAGSLFILFGTMISLNIITLKTLKRDLDINLAGTLVISIVIGNAIINSGVATLIGDSMEFIYAMGGKPGILIGLILLTTILTSFITNVAAVSIAFPIAMELSEKFNIPSAGLYMGIAFAASAAFLTPLSYQTNLMVFGPGGYKFSDFIKVGLPLTVIYLTVVISFLMFLY